MRHFQRKGLPKKKVKVRVKKQRVDNDEDRVIYGGLPMSRATVCILEQQREESELQAREEEERWKEVIQAQVHIYCKANDTVPMPTEHNYIQIPVNATAVVTFLDQSKISVQGMANIDETV